MQITPLAIPEIKVVTPRIFRDERGFFSETFNASIWEDAGLNDVFVQDNHVLSRAPGVLRGLHFQLDPSAQGKLVRAAKGSILDVAVDIRHGSPTFGQHVSRVLSAVPTRPAGAQLLVELLRHLFGHLLRHPRC